MENLSNQMQNWKFGNPKKYYNRCSSTLTFIPMRTINDNAIRFQIGDDPINTSSLNIVTVLQLKHYKLSSEKTNDPEYQMPLYPAFSPQQTPSEKEKLSLVFSYLNESSIYTFFKLLEQFILKAATENPKQWFDRDKISNERAQVSFNSIIKCSNQTRFESRINITSTRMPIIKIATLHETIKDGTLEDLKFGQKIIMDIHVKGLYFQTSKSIIPRFGLSWSLISLLVFEQEQFYRFAITIPDRFKRKHETIDKVSPKYRRLVEKDEDTSDDDEEDNDKDDIDF